MTRLTIGLILCLMLFAFPADATINALYTSYSSDGSTISTSTIITVSPMGGGVVHTYTITNNLGGAGGTQTQSSDSYLTMQADAMQPFSEGVEYYWDIGATEYCPNVMAYAYNVSLRDYIGAAYTQFKNIGSNAPQFPALWLYDKDCQPAVNTCGPSRIVRPEAETKYSFYMYQYLYYRSSSSLSCTQLWGAGTFASHPPPQCWAVPF